MGAQGSGGSAALQRGAVDRVWALQRTHPQPALRPDPPNPPPPRPASSPLRDEPLGAEVPGLVQLLVVVAELGLHGVGAQEHSGLGRAVDLVAEDALLHLQEEELLRDVLDELLGHVLRVELGPELELQRALLPDLLGGHLGGQKPDPHCKVHPQTETRQPGTS